MTTPKRDEVEAVARAMFEARNKHLKNCYSWDDAELDNEHPDCRPALYRDANAAIAVLSAFRGQPCADLLQSIEATLEAVRDIPPNPATRMMIDEDLEKLRSAIESRARDKGNEQAVVIDYTNYRGEKAYRKVVPIRLDFAETEWHPGKQWLMWAFDVDKNDVRAFAMDSIHSWFREFPTPHAAEIITPAPGQSEAIRAEVIAQGVDPNSDKAERMGRAMQQNMLRKAEGEGNV